MSASFSLPQLHFAPESFGPAISPATFEQHHGGHHKMYVDTLNTLADEAGHSDASLIGIIRAAGPGKLFNNAAQHFNHAFYWASLTPSARAPEGDLGAMIDRSFGSVDALKEKLVAAGVGHFASGWAWLVKKGDTLEVVDTHDAATPVTEDGVLPLLVVDVWEHAYYLDHKRARKAYLEAVTADHLNWEFAEKILASGSVEAVDFGIGQSN